MKVHMSPSASRTGRMLQEIDTPVQGWITGQLMGREWLIEAIIPMDISHHPERKFKAAMAHMSDDLLGVFFAHMPVSLEDRFRGDLLLRIRPEGIDAALFSAENKKNPEMDFFPVLISGGLHDKRKTNGKG